MQRKIVSGLIALVLLAAQAPAPVLAADWLTGWDYRKKITVDYTKVPATLTDFPVVVVLASDSDLAAHAASDATDLRVTSSDGTTTLDYERELWNSTTGELVLHFRAPSLSSTTDTEFYLYYGNDGVADGENATGVWSNGFVGVWHLGEASGGRADSTANDNDLSDNATVESGAGRLGVAADFESDNSEFLSIADASQTGLDPAGDFTVEAWIRPESFGSTARPGVVVAKDGDVSSTWNVGINVTGNNSFFYIFKPGSHSLLSTASALVTTTWYHYVWRYDFVTDGASVMNIFRDGSSDATQKSNAVGPPQNSTAFVGIGARDRVGYNDFFDGLIDEVRISSAARDADWIEATYNNQSSPSAFYTLGNAVSSFTPPSPAAGIMAEIEAEIPSERSWTTWAAAIAALFNPVIEMLEGAHDGAVAARDEVCDITGVAFLPGDDYDLGDISLPDDPSSQQIVYQLGLSLGRPVGYLRGIEESGVADLNFLSILIWGVLAGVSWIALVAVGVWAMHAARWVLNVAIRIYELIPFKST